jgi:hypothetical protein
MRAFSPQAIEMQQEWCTEIGMLGRCLLVSTEDVRMSQWATSSDRSCRSCGGSVEANGYRGVRASYQLVGKVWAGCVNGRRRCVGTTPGASMWCLAGFRVEERESVQYWMILTPFATVNNWEMRFGGTTTSQSPQLGQARLAWFPAGLAAP